MIKPYMQAFNIGIESVVLSELICYYHKSLEYEANFKQLHNNYSRNNRFWHELHLIHEKYLHKDCCELRRNLKYTPVKERKFNRIMRKALNGNPS